MTRPLRMWPAISAARFGGAAIMVVVAVIVPLLPDSVVSPRLRAVRPRRSLPRGPSRRAPRHGRRGPRSEEHMSELQSLMRISYAVFCLKKKIIRNTYYFSYYQHIHTNK